MTNVERNTFPWGNLPKEILVEIFGNLPMSDIEKCKRVSKGFSKYLESEDVWKSLFFFHFTINPNLLARIQKHPAFAFKKLVHTPQWDSRIFAHHPEIEISGNGLVGGLKYLYIVIHDRKGKIHHNTKIGVVQAKQVFKSGIHFVQILVNDGGK
jgi:hypothetical protein